MCYKEKKLVALRNQLFLQLYFFVFGVKEVEFGQMI